MVPTMKEASRARTLELPDLKWSVQTNPLRKILVVDDDAALIRFSANVLTGHGYLVGTAEDGEAAWALLQQARFDLLITDNQMPKVCGVELIRKVRGARMALPIIMASGALPLEKFNKAPWLHPAAMLRKPYTVFQLLESVHTVLHTTKVDSEKPAFSPDQPDLPPQDIWRV